MTILQSPPIDGDVLAELRDAIGDGAVVVDPDILSSYQHDSAALCESTPPAVAVLPTTEADVQAIMAVSSRHRVPVVVQGALTGLSGAANATERCIVLSTRRMNTIIELDVENRVAVVQPGVTNKQLKDAAALQGLTYLPDPSSWESSTIGGNIATNAGGLCCVKYGVTARFVRGLRVVLADGRATFVGRRTVKGVAGLSLAELFVGSEGTLGVVTEATVGLDFPAAAPLTVAATFPSTVAAAAAVSRTRAAGITPSLFELLDRTTISAIDAYAKMDFGPSAGAVLIAQSDSGPAAVAELEAIAAICAEAGASDVVVAEDSSESDQLVQARRLAYPALEQLGSPLVDDVSVPLSQLARMIDEVATIADRVGIIIGVVGHAGDGNIHPTVIVDPHDPDSMVAAHRAFDDIAEFALSVGGTITGEHGVGLLKRDLLEKELDPVAMALQRGIKELLDPNYLLNPGKLLTAQPKCQPRQ
ncbi:FAD-binding oxidoreductase [Rhodococcus sp. 06-156-3C]|uniref:FAD-binding oxidoreductase n=1 Tax=Nocardiaceae TaxID=85025 RepID=UPI000522F9F5|nr:MULTISPECIES: FAD-linked oxidase C-terminal domain-containing protein [Rhodococcus]OZD19328.1 FAD-binding oxidoreductase [Rhodococcus sp. 06-156-3C]OZD21663.1 FAD-binding oxidoreductase [Rhodococcus sp. 06-156-4C]OZD25348.1 FAD-binding oxidoreductase [Rhodococcus sp. 06-156-4a]OZD33037.1 FAD-binding oxidoreductase [Rhodococcus sp. 06-156-3b]OZD41887.1 FAD-binding oxidoreductase [Rhodococcus sp. 06-156-3]